MFEKFDPKSLSKLITENILYGLINKIDNNMIIIPEENKNNEINNQGNSYFLPKIASNYEYTLVLDLDETLIHYFYVSFELNFFLEIFYFEKTETTGMFFVRPFMLHFLQELYEMYEIVIFTAATKEVF